MIDLPIKNNPLIDEIVSNLLTIRPNIEISYEYGYKGIANIFLPNDFANDKHHMYIKGNSTDVADLIHELLHIKFGYENKITWKQHYVNNPDNAACQMFICFSSMRDHFRIHKYLVKNRLTSDEECWKTYINSNVNDNDFRCLYKLCDCINEAGQYLDKYKKKLIAKVPTIYKMAIEIMRSHNVEKLVTDEAIIMDTRRKIARLCKLVPSLQNDYKHVIKMPYFFTNSELDENVKKNIVYDVYDLNGQKAIGFFHKNDYVPFEICKFKEESIEAYNMNPSLREFLTCFGKLWWE